MLMTETPQEGLVPDQPVTPIERSIAVLAAMLGALGAATAYTTIRVIGKRAHSLVSVNYFAMIATIGSFVIIMAHPNLHFEIPQSTLQWYGSHIDICTTKHVKLIFATGFYSLPLASQDSCCNFSLQKAFKEKKAAEQQI